MCDQALGSGQVNLQVVNMHEAHAFGGIPAVQAQAPECGGVNNHVVPLQECMEGMHGPDAGQVQLQGAPRGDGSGSGGSDGDVREAIQSAITRMRSMLRRGAQQAPQVELQIWSVLGQGRYGTVYYGVCLWATAVETLFFISVFVCIICFEDWKEGVHVCREVAHATCGNQDSHLPKHTAAARAAREGGGHCVQPHARAYRVHVLP